ncbi:hypothetical protein RHSIM_Rhsim01G0066900 [Rhododendron simsii]|uniref:Phytocyanin domain-containing protein n=1 Tax=Rhododendron simsii TaxID=118357 RepID=A0A834HNR1_RHOSS|nr:hypothetical protein RHSIM_Rhsim01G0066900 [Rhododendron simsii]
MAKRLTLAIFVATILAALHQTKVAPASPPPAAPASVAEPPRTPMTYVVGDGLGWIVPPTPMFFNFINGTQDVAELAGLVAWPSDPCNTTTTTLTLTSSPAKITLATAGHYFFKSTYPRHCLLGQQLAIVALATSPSASPLSSTVEPPNAQYSPAAGVPASPPSSSAPSTTTIGLFCVTFLSLLFQLSSFDDLVR